MIKLDPFHTGGMVRFLFDGPFSQIWPLLVLPALAAFISHVAAKRLLGTKSDWRLAAALAALPGLVMLGLILMVFGRATAHLHGGGFEHLLKYHVPMVAGALLIARTVWRHERRRKGLRAVARLACPPSQRLAAAAKLVGLRVAELPQDSCECFIAGALRPTAFVSRGAVARMTDEELVAALHHESAHGSSRDPAMLELLTFLGDLAPGSARALTAYRCARERRADSVAAERAGACALASALLAMSRAPAPVPAGAFSMGGLESGVWRLEAILGIESRAAPRRASPLLVWTCFGANGALLMWPLAHVVVAYQLCGSGA